MTALSKDEFFQQYRVKYKIGEGGYGSVFKIQDLKGSFFALKTIVCNTLDQLNRSFQEIVTIFRVKNPGIVDVRGFLIDKKNIQYSNGQIYEVYILGIIMEYAEASLHDDLTQRRASQRFYTKDIVYSLTLTLVDLLAEFQAEKVAHRDLKPENILLTKLGFKLTDFGLAKVETSRRSNSYAGSPFYVSPKLREAVEKEDFSNLDHDVYKSDVFSLGLNILEAASLCDVRSLNSMKSMKLIEEIIQRLAKAYDRWFIRLLRKMLEFDEEKRPDFVQLKEMVNLEMKESKRYNPFLDPNFQEVYQQDVYSYIKESVEKFGGNVAQQEKERMEKVQVNYENIIVKKQNNNLNANNETKENEKAGDIFDEVVRKTEKRKKNQNNKQLKEDLEYTKKINPPKFHEPIILQEHKVQTMTGSKGKSSIDGPASVIIVARTISFGKKLCLLTAGEESMDLFLVTPSTKPLQSLQKLKFPKINFLCMIDLMLTVEKVTEEKFLIFGTKCGKLGFFRFIPEKPQLEQIDFFPDIHKKAITSIGALKGQDIILTGSSDFSVRVIHISLDKISGKLNPPSLLKVLLGHSNGVTCVEGFGGETEHFALSGSLDNSLIVWNLAKAGQREKSIKWDCDWISCMKLYKSPNEERVFCGSGNKGILVFNARSGLKEKQWDYLNEFIEGWISFIDYNEDYDILIICEGKGKIILVDSRHRKKIVNFEEAESDISGAFIVKKLNNQEFLLLITNFDGKIRYLEISEFT